MAHHEKPVSPQKSERNSTNWEEFPHDLFEEVIAKLPIPDIFLLRSVCRKWKSLLSSHSFSPYCDAEIQRLRIPWLLFNTNNNNNNNNNPLVVYDPCLDKYHMPSIPSRYNSHHVSPMASAGGLVCLQSNKDKYIYVCNPLTNSSREVPRAPRGWVAGMTVNMDSASNGGYKILCMRFKDPLRGYYEVYDSIKNNWFTGLRELPRRITLYIWRIYPNIMSNSWAIGSKIYCLHRSRISFNGVCSLVIISYDTENDEWHKFKLRLSMLLIDCGLVDFEGKIMVVGLTEMGGVQMWELLEKMTPMKEVDRMPHNMCLDLRFDTMNCYGNGNLLLLIFTSTSMNKMVSYDMETRAWQIVPAFTFPCRWMQYVAAFYPSLTASP